MRILFLCGSLEPGRDGVGDYTRRLASEIIRQDHQVAIIALHDKHWQHEAVESVQNDKLQEINTLRLSSQSTWEYKVLKSSEFINEFNPDWISLQYVPFSFQDKGMPYGLVRVMRQLSKGRKLHIMFHELWVGVEANSSLKLTIWGFMQKIITKRMLAQLKFDVVHTQAKLHLYMLSKLEHTAKLLPLFGNIPVTVRRQDLMKQPDTNTLSFVVFGGIHEHGLINEFADDLSTYADSKGIAVKFIFLGNNGKLRDEWIQKFTGKGFLVESIGEQPTEVISKIFMASTFGLTSTPLLLSDKSGSVAAMLEHEMTVLCVRQKWVPKYNFSCSDYQAIQYSNGNFNEILTEHTKSNHTINSVDKIASTLLNTFTNQL